MLVYVLNKYNQPLMPCSPAKARHLLKDGKARVERKEPFTIKLLFGSTGYKQEVVAGMDTGSKVIGAAAIANNEVVYQSEVTLRNDVSSKMEQRKMYRGPRRAKKTRYRPARFSNRGASMAKGRIAPSIRSKVASHLREKNFIESILPASRWKVELASFDIHKINNPNVKGVGYQEGDQKGYYNTKAYVLYRDGYKCLSKQKCNHSKKLHVHHIVFRSKGGSDAPSNLITLCESCHNDLHDGKFEIKGKRSITKHATEVGIIKSRLSKSGWKFEPVFGYETKYKREQFLKLEKSHVNDAIAICCEDGQVVSLDSIVYRKRHVAKGDYRQTRGKRSHQRIPTGKLFGLRKFDKVGTSRGIGFVKSKRKNGCFDIFDIDGNIFYNSAKAMKCVRISARSTTLTDLCSYFSHMPSKTESVLSK